MIWRSRIKFLLKKKQFFLLERTLMINFAKINIVFRISLCRTEIRCKENTLVAVQNKGVDSLISFFFFFGHHAANSFHLKN